MDIKEKIPDIATTTDVPTLKKGMTNGQRITFLVIGDVLVFLIFSAIGRRSHGEAAGLSAFVQIALTAAPFAFGWFLVSPFLGAFRRGLETQPRKMATRTALAWLAAWPVGLIVRGFVEKGLPLTFVIPPWTFALVTLITNMLFLLLWRWPFALINAWRKRSSLM